MVKDRFDFKHFSIRQENVAMRITTDGVLLGAWAIPPAKGKLLDVGAGTGLLSLMMAQKSETEITALEPDKNSLSDLNLNIQHSSWHKRIRVLPCTLEELADNQEYSKYYDFIISNPPYYVEGSLPEKANHKNARHTVSLTHPSLLKHVSVLLNESGGFAVILPEIIAESFVYRATQHQLYCNRWTDIIPETGKPVLRRMMLFEREKKNLVRTSISIREGQRYSQNFLALTKDFYLGLGPEGL